MNKIWGISAAAVLLAGCGNPADQGADGSFKTVEIGGQTWMAENLNIKTARSWCYENKASNCAAYGRLYAWEAAMAACPAGWHLPADSEWGDLAAFAGGEDSAGAKLKSKSPHWNGSDDYGFSAMPGGAVFDKYFLLRVTRVFGGSFKFLGVNGAWWTSTPAEGDKSLAYFRGMGARYAQAKSVRSPKDLGASVRYVRD